MNFFVNESVNIKERDLTIEKEKYRKIKIMTKQGSKQTKHDIVC